MVADEGKFFLADWRSIVEGDRNRRNQTNQRIAKWEKQSPGWMKLNSDAAVDERCGVMGLGWVLRDDQGNFIAAIGIPGKGVFTPSEAEGMAVREALSWLKVKGITKVHIETDALQVIQQLSEDE
ncbi:uncharacterized protein LOC116023495 [Ipomoea triloba]|uniref:uncharacterized protein LOC116023495 n=1 Tax=Ipomoea triloba TaxID=35885 RepID=UPI00125E4E65|nr:uncharacterized protein LOC116023495 [Ipomoea triloba]